VWCGRPVSEFRKSRGNFSHVKLRNESTSESGRALYETAMTVLSTLRQRTHPTIAGFSKTYAAHRPLVQRILTAGFIANVLVTTFRGLLTRPSVPSTTSKGKARGQSAPPDSGKSQRVAVRTSLFRPAHMSDFLVARLTQCFIRDSLGSSGS
jgi:hypothetical protein